jgi:hypothetical protein
MDVESIIELAVLELREAAGYRLTRKDRQDLARLRAYVEWRERTIEASDASLRALWADSEVPEG